MRHLWMWGLVVGMGLMLGCVPISAPTPAATVENGAAAPVEAAVPAPDELEARATSISPDGQWRAESMAAFPADRDEYYQRLTVTRSDGQVSWTPVETWSPMGLGYTVAVSFAWSTQTASLYFTNLPAPDGCALFVNGWGLQRLDLATGQVTEVVPRRGLTLAPAPAEDIVAEITDRPPILTLHDLVVGNTFTVTLPVADATTQAGSLVWSPDGTRIALALAHDPCTGGWARATSVLVVDAITLEAITLLGEDDRLLKPVEWKTADALTLEGEGGTRFILDPTTRELMPSP